MFYKILLSKSENDSVLKALLDNFNYCKSYKDIEKKLQDIQVSIFISNYYKNIIHEKIKLNNKIRFMFTKLIFRYKIRKAFTKTPWNEKCAVSLTEIEELSEEDKITIVSNGKRFVFEKNELVKSIDISLHSTSQFTFIAEPQEPINPWTGAKFTLNEIVSIFNQFDKKNVKLPLYLILYKECSYSIDQFVFQNQYLISINGIKTFYQNIDDNLLIKCIQSDITSANEFSVRDYDTYDAMWDHVELINIKKLCMSCVKEWIKNKDDTSDIRNILIQRQILYSKLIFKKNYRKEIQSEKLDTIKHILDDKEYQAIFSQNHKSEIKFDLSAPPMYIKYFLSLQKEHHKRIFLKGKKTENSILAERKLLFDKIKRVQSNYYKVSLIISDKLAIKDNKVLQYLYDTFEKKINYSEFLTSMNILLENNFEYYKRSEDFPIHDYWGKRKQLELNTIKSVISISDEKQKSIINKKHKKLIYVENDFVHTIKRETKKYKKDTDAEYIKSLH